VTQEPAYHSISSYGDLNGPVTKHSSFFSTETTATIRQTLS
jgi:hypothetical protein